MLKKAIDFCCAGRSWFGRRAEPEHSEGGWSEAQPNREGVAAGGATEIDNLTIITCLILLFDLFAYEHSVS